MVVRVRRPRQIRSRYASISVSLSNATVPPLVLGEASTSRARRPCARGRGVSIFGVENPGGQHAVERLASQRIRHQPRVATLGFHLRRGRHAHHGSPCSPVVDRPLRGCERGGEQSRLADGEVNITAPDRAQTFDRVLAAPRSACTSSAPPPSNAPMPAEVRVPQPRRVPGAR
jgi:hypothetical protein